MSVQEKIMRFAGELQPVIIAGRMTEAGCPTTETTVRRWFEGSGNVSFEKLPYLARALNCTVDDLVESEVA